MILFFMLVVCICPLFMSAHDIPRGLAQRRALTSEVRQGERSRDRGHRRNQALKSGFKNIAHFSFKAADRITSFPYISGDLFRLMGDFVVDGTTLMPDIQSKHSVSIKDLPFDPDMVKAGDIIFVHGRTAQGGLVHTATGRGITRPHFLEYFFETLHPHIKVPYILLSANDDSCTPGVLAFHLNDPKIIAWFGINYDGFKHPKFYPIPIGLCNAQRCSMSAVKKVEEYAQTAKKEILFYVNIFVGTNPELRGSVKETLSKKSFSTVIDEKKPFEDYLKDLAHAKFVASPPGNGLDCYRTWEAFLMGCIPVMEHSSLDPLFDGLPVLLIDRWEDLTEQFLQIKWQEMNKKTYNKKKMYAEYWMQRIRDCQTNYQALLSTRGDGVCTSK